MLWTDVPNGSDIKSSIHHGIKLGTIKHSTSINNILAGRHEKFIDVLKNIMCIYTRNIIYLRTDAVWHVTAHDALPCIIHSDV